MYTVHNSGNISLLYAASTFRPVCLNSVYIDIGYIECLH